MRGNGLNKVFIDFSSVKDMTLKELYGEQPIPITQLTKKLWGLIHEKSLQIKNTKKVDIDKKSEQE